MPPVPNSGMTGSAPNTITRSLLVIAIVLAVGVDTAGLEAQSAPNDSVWRALPCQGSREYYADGQLRRCILAGDSRVGVHDLPAGSEVTLSRGARLAQARLAREASFFGQTLPANTTVNFFGDGTLRSFWLAADTVIQGHLLRAQHDGAGAELHRTGKLRAFELARDEAIDGVPCTSRRNPFRLGLSAFVNGDGSRVLLHPNGHLRQCRVSRSVSIEDSLFARGQVVRLRPDRTVERGPEGKH